MALAAFVMSILALSFQILSFLLTGSRIKVELQPAILTNLGTVVRGPHGGWNEAKAPPTGRHFDPKPHAWIECAEITVSNVGRLPATVHDVGLDFGPTSGQPWTVTILPIERDGYCTETTNVRLEPGEAKSVLVPLLSTMRYALNNHEDATLIIRGHARRAGKRSGALSPQLDSWRIRKGTERLYPYALPTTRVEVFQLLAEEWPSRELGADLYDAWVRVCNALLPHPDLEDLDVELTPIEDVLAEVFDDPIQPIMVKRRLEQLMTTPSPARQAGAEDDPPLWMT